jgi:ABC-type antimicrobial peptide transport system permease subunit
VFGVQAAHGPTFKTDEFTPGRGNAVVLAHPVWARRYGADPSIVGRAVSVNGRPYTVVGVMPPSFEYPGRRYGLWAPLPSPRTPEMPPVNRSAHYLQVVGLLKPSATLAQADAELKTIASALEARFPETNGNTSARVTPLQDHAVRDVATPLYVLLGAVGLVVLIACANVTNLLLARATARHREVAIRQALGAGRWRLVRQFLSETAVLYALGAAGALALASWGASALVALGPADIPRLTDTTLDGRVLAATSSPRCRERKGIPPMRCAPRAAAPPARGARGSASASRSSSRRSRFRSCCSSAPASRCTAWCG